MYPVAADKLEQRCGPGRCGAHPLENMVIRQYHACPNVICLIKKLSGTQRLLSLTPAGNFIIMEASKATIALIA
jgi:hypothetical protein